MLMTSATTSVHWLNADRGLGHLRRFFYFALNWANNLFPFLNVDPDLKICNFYCDDIRAKWHQLPTTSSPSRKLSDLFCLSLPWNDIKEELGNIHVLDTGCGSGNLGPRLMNWSGDAITSYTGTDMVEHPNWRNLCEKYPFLHFITSRAEAVQPRIPDGTNFIMSQSAIEHFDNDLLYFEQIRDYVCSYKRSVIQVHLIPSSACLRLYGLHGVRQYTPRTISKITRLFEGFSYRMLFHLGGEACNDLHYEFILKSGRDLRDLKGKEYDRRLLAAIEADMQNSQTVPAFYALFIHSNWRRKLFW